jgi:hypothetical protein
MGCERRKSRAVAWSQAGAPLPWTNERADTLFVCEQVRKAAATSASLSERSEQSERSAIREQPHDLTWATPARTAKVSIGCIAKCPLARQESAIVSWNPSRASQAGRIRFRAGAVVLALRGGLSLLLVIGLLLVSGACGQNVQTNLPYTSAEGVNLDVGDPADPDNVVHVRNLLLISWAPGEAVVSASIVTNGRDALTAVSGTPIKVDGTEGAPFTATLGNTVSVANGAQVVLTDQSPITVKSPDLMAGLDAIVTVVFQNAGEATVRAPVVDGNEPQYATIKPTPTPTSSA